MSDRFEVIDRLPNDIHEKLGEAELDELEGVIQEELKVQDETLSELRTQNLSLQSERDALQRRIGDIEQEERNLRNRVEELEAARLRFDPTSVVADFGSALDAASEERDYRVTDFQVDLRTSIVSTDDGIKLQFPTPFEDVDTRNLSTLKFGIRHRPDATTNEYREVPAVEGLDRTAAERLIKEGGLSVGEIETVESEVADIVLEQFPQPYMLAESGTDVDLIVSVIPESDSDEPATGDDRLREIKGIGPRRAELLRDERIDGARTLLETDPERIAEITGVSIDQAKSWLLQARELQ